jgi:uncharacterized membrane protein
VSRNSIAACLVNSALFLGASIAMSQPVQFDFRSFDVPGAASTFAFGINPQGEIVGRYASGAFNHGYLLNKGTVTTIDPPYGLGVFAAAQGINPEGNIAGNYTDRGTVPGGDAIRTRAYLRDASGSFMRIDFPGAENTLAIKISPTGQVVGCYHHQNADTDAAHGGTMHGYVYQNGTYQSLSVPGTMNNGITRNGRIIVGVWFPTPNEFHAYKVEDGVYALLDLPNYVVLSDARDVNPSGEIVGFFVDPSGKNHGFLLNRQSFTPIDFPGGDVAFTHTLGIDPEGNITGYYTTKDGHTHGFVATRSQGRDSSVVLP